MADSCEFFLRKVKAIVSDAGFVVRTVEKHDYHHLYEVRMKTGDFDLSFDGKLAGRQIRRLLVRGGIVTDSVIVRQSKKYVRIGFLCLLGAPGVLR